MSNATDVRFDERSALVVVDVQNDFADPEGGLYVAEGEQTIPVINDLVAQAQSAGAAVVYTQDWHPETTPHFVKDGGVWPVHCVQGTWGAEIHRDVDVVGPIVQKGVGGEDGYSGFTVRDPVTGDDSPTDLEALLRERGAEHVVVIGLAHDVCVKATALDARRLGFDTTVVRAATRAVNLQPGDDQRADAEMAAAGVALH